MQNLYDVTVKEQSLAASPKTLAAYESLTFSVVTSLDYDTFKNLLDYAEKVLRLINHYTSTPSVDVFLKDMEDLVSGEASPYVCEISEDKAGFLLSLNSFNRDSLLAVLNTIYTVKFEQVNLSGVFYLKE